MKKAIVAISGGIDSAVAAAIAKEAMTLYTFHIGILVLLLHV